LYDELDFCNTGMKIAIASDHGGYHLKEAIKSILKSLGVEYHDFGTSDTESVDYPDYAALVAKEVQKGSRGILCCGTGVGMSITANKFKGVRAALCHDSYTAEMSRKHNDANVLVLGGRVEHVSEQVETMVKIWLETDYEGGRHQKRLEKISKMEGKD
jgi:ribose 5-phosphate isomerase B